MRKKQEKGNRKAEKQRKKEENGKENEDKRAEKRARSGKPLNSVAVYKTSSIGGSSTSKVYPTGRVQNKNDRSKLPCTSGDVCAVCCGVYVDDDDDITGEIVKDCIQCTDDECGVWSHADCLEKEVGVFICGVCLNLLFN